MTNEYWEGKKRKKGEPFEADVEHVVFEISSAGNEFMFPIFINVVNNRNIT